jgi:hypothetical protein
MIWFAAGSGLVLMAAIDLVTFRVVGSLPSPRPWRVAAVGSLVMGAALGIWLGCLVTYQVAPDLPYIGFPCPCLVLQLENGRWVDYVGLIPLIAPFNVFMIASSCLLPVSSSLLIRRLLAGSR